MTKSLQDLLANRVPIEPPEIEAIKTFVSDHLHIVPKVTLGQQSITITMPNAAAAGSLRLQLYDLQQILKTDKKLVIRIGN